jgi:hypothetical protein
MKFLWIAALLFSGLAHGQSGQCGFIRDSDMQAACRARFG